MVKLIKPVFYEDINELLGGLLKKKRKKKITYNSSKYSILDKIEPLPLRRRAIPAIPAGIPAIPIPAAPRGLMDYFTGLVPGSRKPAKKVSTSKPATKPPRKRRTKAEMMIDRLREAEIKEAKKAPKKALKALRVPEGEEYEAPLAIEGSPKPRGRPPKSPAEKAEVAAEKKETAAVKKAEVAAVKREEGLKKSKSGSLEAIFGKVPQKVSPKAAKAPAKPAELGSGKFKKLKRKKQK